MRGKSYLLGGIVLCAFPATVLFAMHQNGARLPMPWPILFGLFFLYGIRTVAVSLFKLDIDGVLSWVVDAIAAAGFAVMAFWIAWKDKDEWNGDWLFLPHNWNQYIARILFAVGGVIATLFAARCLKKALNQYRKKPDEGIWHE